MKGSIDELALPKRIENRLRFEGIRTVRALLKQSPLDLLGWHGFGLSSLWTVRNALEDRGLSLKDDPGKHEIYRRYMEREQGKGGSPTA